MAITTAMPTSFKGELLSAVHNFTTTTGSTFKLALTVGTSMAGTYGAATTNYSNLTGNSDELANGSGYTTGGYNITAANNVTAATSGTTAFTTPNASPNWTSATFTTAGCIMYNADQSNKAAYVGSFGGNQTVTSGTFTIVMPANTAAAGLLRIQ